MCPARHLLPRLIKCSAFAKLISADQGSPLCSKYLSNLTYLGTLNTGNFSVQ